MRGSGNPGWEKGDAEGRRPPPKRKLLRRCLWAVGIGASILGVCALPRALAQSPLLVVRQIELEASGRPGPDEIGSLSGIRTGMSLLSLDAEGASRRLETHPWIRKARVVKRPPDRVLIQVCGRRPVAVLGMREGLFYLDGEGKILDKIRAGEPLDFPMITGLGQDARDARRCGEGRDLHQALSLLRALQASPSLGRVSEIHVDRSEGLSFVLEGFPLPVDVGWSEYTVKTIRFQKALPSLVSHAKAIERVDLRFSDQIVVRHGTGGNPWIHKGDGTETWAGSDSPFHPT